MQNTGNGPLSCNQRSMRESASNKEIFRISPSRTSSVDRLRATGEIHLFAFQTFEYSLLGAMPRARSIPAKRATLDAVAFVGDSGVTRRRTISLPTSWTAMQ